MNVTELDPPNLNTGEPWGDVDTWDLLWCLTHKTPVSQIADFLCRTRKEIRDRARDLDTAICSLSTEMTQPPKPDKLPGPIRYKKPTGKKQKRPSDKLRKVARRAKR